jgi:hypothetical protein
MQELSEFQKIPKKITKKNRYGDTCEVVDGHHDLLHVVRVPEFDELEPVRDRAVVPVQHKLDASYHN